MQIMVFSAAQHFYGIWITIGQQGNQLAECIDSGIGVRIRYLPKILMNQDFPLAVQGTSANIQIAGFHAGSIGMASSQCQ